jgi:hypothetical protein
MKIRIADIFLVRATAPGVSHRDVFRFERDRSAHVTGVVLTLERPKGLRLTRRRDGGGEAG